MLKWEVIIGLECHVQLNTASKLFCSCPQPASTATPHNTLTCDFCTGRSGEPVLAGDAIELGVRAALALGCSVQPVSRFERKRYSNPDLPKGYQLTQQRHPIARGGLLRFEGGALALRGLHVEEDAGRRSGVVLDLNRAGAALIEVVSEPDLRSPEAAEAVARMLRRVMVEAGVTRGELAEGHMRFDVNVSVRKPGEAAGEWVEVKNLNSFRAIRRAGQVESDRQIALIDSGGVVEAETRAWDGKTTRKTRRRLSGADYAFETSLLPSVQIDAGELERAGAGLNAPLDRWLLTRDREERERWRTAYGLDDETIAVLSGDPVMAAFFQAAVEAGAAPTATAGWLRGEVTRALRETPGVLEDCALTPGSLAVLVGLVAEGRLTRTAGRQVLSELMVSGGDPAALAAAREGLNDAALRTVATQVIDANSQAVERYQSGRTSVLGFFVGAVMRATDGRADPEAAEAVLAELLES